MSGAASQVLLRAFFYETLPIVTGCGVVMYAAGNLSPKGQSYKKVLKKTNTRIAQGYPTGKDRFKLPERTDNQRKIELNHTRL